MSTHTPGPWQVDNDHGGVASVSEPRKLIAVAYGDRDDCKTDDRMRANARLIAAAPDLYEALRELVRVSETDAGDDIRVWSTAMLQARAAIAKATGSES